jgi:ribosomal-protein-alanine N-acetyltransferase
MAEAPGPTLWTDRLVLRRWLERDLAPFAAMNADPEVMRYFTRPLGADESDAMVGRIESRFDEHGYGLWAVERRADRAFLGFTGLATTESLGFVGPAAALLGPPPIPEAEIGWRFARFAWGQGYATEAARAALRFGFDSAGMHEIVSLTSTLNLRSMRVMERIGLHRDPAEDFDHPRIPEGSPIRRHALYRLTGAEFRDLP